METQHRRPMLAKQFKAKEIFISDEARLAYVTGWEMALELASGLMRDVNQPNLAVLVKGIGRAEVNPETGKPIAFD